MYSSLNSNSVLWIIFDSSDLRPKLSIYSQSLIIFIEIVKI